MGQHRWVPKAWFCATAITWSHCGEDYSKEWWRVVGEMRARKARKSTNTIKEFASEECEDKMKKGTKKMRKEGERWKRSRSRANGPNSCCASRGQNWHCDHMCFLTIVWLTNKLIGPFGKWWQEGRDERQGGRKFQFDKPKKEKDRRKGKRIDFADWIISQNLWTETNNLLSVGVMKSLNLRRGFLFSMCTEKKRIALCCASTQGTSEEQLTVEEETFLEIELQLPLHLSVSYKQ